MLLSGLSSRAGYAESPEASEEDSASVLAGLPQHGEPPSPEEPSPPSEEPPPDWNPLSSPASSLKTWLAGHGVSYQLDLGFTYQYASEVQDGKDHFATFPWRLLGDWVAIDSERFGQTYLEWNLLGAVGLNYDLHEEGLAYNVGSISYPNTNAYEDPFAINELFLAQVSPSERFELLVGKIDMYYLFDLNRVANDGFSSFLSFALESNRSIPFPEYGGLGVVAYADVTGDVSVMFGAGDSSSVEPLAFWRTVTDGSWWQLLEIEWRAGIKGLGKGTYRVTPWHSQLHGEDGWGVGLNIDQELGLPWLIAFLRAGVGDGDVTPVERFVSGGLVILEPLGRSRDMIGVGAAWSKPSPDFGVRNETLLEFFYRIALTPSIHVTPDLQIIFSPAANPDPDVVVVPGIRLVFQL
jgi:porin